MTAVDEMPSDEEELIGRARRGSHEAFTALVRAHQGAVRAYLSRFAGGAEEIDDIAQEVFLAAYRSLEDFDGRSRLRSWLIGIARHRALSWLRDRRRRCRREGRLVDEALAAALEEQAPQSEQRDGERLVAMHDCLDGLPGSQGALLTRRYLHDEALDDLARDCGRSVGALRVALHRLRAVLRTCIEGRLAERSS